MLFIFLVVETTGAVSIIGGKNQWLIAGQSAELTCAPSDPALIDRVEWSRSSGRLPADVKDNEGVLRFDPFKVWPIS